MEKNKAVVIMAGGKGTRLWPLSTAGEPKQFISLTDDKTLIQETVGRLLPYYDEKDIFIVTNKAYQNLVKQQLPNIPDENVYFEPASRNTAPCIALISYIFQKRYPPDTTMSVLPSDHLISDEKTFIDILKYTNQKACEEKTLFTLGIKPDFPHTGFGYIQCNMTDKTNNNQHYNVMRFVEKPDETKAAQYLKEGNYFWNAGMFVWRLDIILEELNKYVTSTMELLKPLAEIPNTQEQSFLEEHFDKCESISIDYAVMEKSDRVCCTPAQFGWNDIGSWTAVKDIMERKNDNYPVCKNLVQIDSSDNMVHAPQKNISLIGVKDLVIVEKGDNILICTGERAQEVKKLAT